MKSKIRKTISFSVIILLSVASFSFGQNKSKETTTKSDSANHMKMDMKKMRMTVSSKKMKRANSTKINNALEYKGMINLEEIDKNKDGKVYQCPMDFNVLSDKPGTDPKCGMKLKEVTIKQAKNNLIKHGFKVK